MTFRVVLVAHGATSATRLAAFPRDEPLEPAALLAAAELAGTLPLTADRAVVVTAPQLRCQQTATQLGLTASTDEGLRDWDAGRWAGQSLGSLTEQEPDGVQAWLGDPAARPNGGETLDELLLRTGSWLDAVPSSRTIAVTHPAILRAAAVHALTAGSRAFWRIDVPPLTVLLVTGGPGRWSVRLH